MTPIATLGADIRLIAIQFHMKASLVPAAVPNYNDFHQSPKDKKSTGGRRIMSPIKDVLIELFSDFDYQLIDAWHTPCEDNWSMREVRYVFCHPDHLNLSGLNPAFATLRESLMASLHNLLSKNLWQTMAHINPYFVNEKATSEEVMMLDCNSRRETTKLVPLVQSDLFSSDTAPLPTSLDDEEDGEHNLPEQEPTLVEKPVMVYRDGRDKLTRRGIGPLVLLTDKASRLKLVEGAIVLENPSSTHA